MRILNILVLEDMGTPSLNTVLPTYTTFVSPKEANILIITSTGGLSQKDKKASLANAEVPCPSVDGSVELIAFAWHKEFTIDQIYTRHEDLLVRAASLREMLGIDHGMMVNSAFAFRNKCLMKEILIKHKVPVLAHKRLYTPCDLIMFADSKRFPLIVKPILGSASAGIQILRSHKDMADYLSKEFLHSQLSDSSGKFDCSGDLMVEAMFPSTTKMYHVNGLLVNGKVVAIWPFAYISNNLSFTQGKPYGNLALIPDDPFYNELISATQDVLNAYKMESLLPQTMAFHAEFFLVDPIVDTAQLLLTLPRTLSTPKPHFILCEIAARRPGGSIVQLMDGMLMKSNNPFSKMEFRAFAGLSIPNIALNKQVRTADLLIPHQPMSQLIHMPDPKTFPSSDTMLYVPSKGFPSGRVYTHFSVNSMNTVARFKYHGSMSLEDTISVLYKAATWFSNNVDYVSITCNDSRANDENTNSSKLLGCLNSAGTTKALWSSRGQIGHRSSMLLLKKIRAQAASQHIGTSKTFDSYQPVNRPQKHLCNHAYPDQNSAIAGMKFYFDQSYGSHSQVYQKYIPNDTSGSQLIPRAHNQMSNTGSAKHLRSFSTKNKASAKPSGLNC